MPPSQAHSPEDLLCIDEALKEAALALKHNDVPVGAVVLKDGKIIGRGHNQRELHHDPCSHAEIEALRDAAKNLGDWNLSGCKLYVTLEPCAMCAGAISSARIEELVYSAADPKAGALSLQLDILDNPRLPHRVKLRRGPKEKECAASLKKFFQDLRREK